MGSKWMELGKVMGLKGRVGDLLNRMLRRRLWLRAERERERRKGNIRKVRSYMEEVEKRETVFYERVQPSFFWFSSYISCFERTRWTLRKRENPRSTE